MSRPSWPGWRGPLVLAVASACAAVLASSCRSATTVAPPTAREPVPPSRPPAARVGLPDPDIARLAPAPNLRIGVALDVRRASVGTDSGVVVFGQSADGSWSGRRTEVQRATFVPVATSQPPRAAARFRVQVGSFADERGAREVAARAEQTARLPAVVGRLSGSERYQVRIGEFASRDEAQAKAGELHRAGFPGSFVAEDARPAPTGRVRLLETGDEFSRATILPAGPQFLSVDSAGYRGVFELRSSDGPGFDLINVVGLEDYLKGVVPNELSPSAFPQIEALKAQAVAARTYAQRNRGQFAAQGYDLCATATCQVYRGQSTEHPLSSRAVDETRGQVATYRGEAINALYTSTCGGHTEDGGNVFEEGAPYLKGVVCTPERTSFAAIRTSVVPRALEDDADLTRGAALLVSLGVVEPKVYAAQALKGVPNDAEIRAWTKHLLVSLKRKGCPPPVSASLARRGTFFQYLVGSLCWDERAARLLAPGDPAYLLALEDRDALSREGERQAAALLLAEGIVSPFPDNTLRPGVALTRRQVVVLLARAGERAGLPDLVSATFQGTSADGLDLLRGDERQTTPVDPALRLFRNLDGASAAASEVGLAVGDDVRYVARDGRIVFLEVEQGRKGVAADRDSRYYRWEVRLTPEAVAEAVARYGKVGTVRDLEARRIGVSGRIVELAVRGSDGDLLLKGLKVRWGLGLRENLFVIDRERDPRGGVERFVFTGKGWGHGVGLCQVGAFGMAQAGSTFEQILKHYYTGIALDAQGQRGF